MATSTTTVPSSARGGWDLAENEVRTLPADAAIVRVHRGTVLVTQEGDREDHVLEAGTGLVLRRRGRAVAWAFTAATLSVCREPRPRHPPSSGVREVPQLVRIEDVNLTLAVIAINFWNRPSVSFHAEPGTYLPRQASPAPAA